MEDVPVKGSPHEKPPHNGDSKKFKKCPVCKGEKFLRVKRLQRTYEAYLLRRCSHCGGSGSVLRSR
ncbi:hypothetical protein COU15_03220 [Candidatus Kaiserbacteria bacterium CG10_big_fil_rev_8_21_14_0_10_45_20]|uniref:Uncharacterized protein n=1 Tax=Candidatus Kaiserbacteria bacterium CG10_big_fil_rev_8_21_14_0_10_45_20 TaxID=1974607 RepID=A0A2H0UH31_9BACT|nr:MAG: hypothetical protein COU15_03220 [Candidatus Kaiserbacteria bacterium CG10_big_fil_rev_8_21_14_0_10_45_20]